jgi:hypothetical protein
MDEPGGTEVKVLIEIDEDHVEDMLDAVREALDERSDNAQDLSGSLRNQIDSVEFDELVVEVNAIRALKRLRDALKKPIRPTPMPDMPALTRGVWLESGMVWMLVAPAEEGVEAHVEFFDSRPRSIGVGGDESNWSSTYRIYEGFVNGGDSELIEQVENGKVTRLVNSWGVEENVEKEN